MSALQQSVMLQAGTQTYSALFASSSQAVDTCLLTSFVESHHRPWSYITGNC